METMPTTSIQDFQERLRGILPSRVYTVLQRAGFVTPEALSRLRTPEDCLKIRGIGKRHLPILLEAINHILTTTRPVEEPRHAHGPTADERAIYESYKRHRSYRAVADELRITTRDVIMTLEKGAKAGWWVYDHPSVSRESLLQMIVPRAVLVQAYCRYPSTQQVARALKIPFGAVQRLAHAYGYTTHQLTLIGRRHRTSEEIEALLATWGRRPTHRELRYHPDWRRLYTRIRALWRTFEGYEQWRKAMETAHSDQPTDTTNGSSPTPR
jgi:uncharacterized protein (DUF433 family)